MFTGLVEEIGYLRSRNGSRFVFDARTVLEDTKIDDSISVSGACLTVVDIEAGSFSIDAVDETLARTTLGALLPGDPVNLERAARLNDRLGGHIVQGHVDAVGVVVEPGPHLRIRIPKHLSKYVVDKGSITVDGISLTVVNAYDDGFSVALIPHTLEHTTIGKRQAGDKVNIEIDVIARYAERILNFKENS